MHEMAKAGNPQRKYVTSKEGILNIEECMIERWRAVDLEVPWFGLMDKRAVRTKALIAFSKHF
jgi:hypothetical protein